MLSHKHTGLQLRQGAEGASCWGRVWLLAATRGGAYAQRVAELKSPELGAPNSTGQVPPQPQPALPNVSAPLMFDVMQHAAGFARKAGSPTFLPNCTTSSTTSLDVPLLLRLPPLCCKLC